MSGQYRLRLADGDRFVTAASSFMSNIVQRSEVPSLAPNKSITKKKSKEQHTSRLAFTLNVNPIHSPKMSVSCYHKVKKFQILATLNFTFCYSTLNVTSDKQTHTITVLFIEVRTILKLTLKKVWYSNVYMQVVKYL